MESKQSAPSNSSYRDCNTNQGRSTGGNDEGSWRQRMLPIPPRKARQPTQFDTPELLYPPPGRNMNVGLPPLGLPGPSSMLPPETRSDSQSSAQPGQQTPENSENQLQMAGQKWTAEEDDYIMRQRCTGAKWEVISQNLPGRTAQACRQRMHNNLDPRALGEKPSGGRNYGFPRDRPPEPKWSGREDAVLINKRL
jgi:hypothetical protein